MRRRARGYYQSTIRIIIGFETNILKIGLPNELDRSMIENTTDLIKSKIELYILMSDSHSSLFNYNYNHVTVYKSSLRSLLRIIVYIIY